MKKQKSFYKRINFGLKNAIVIRTNIDPFKINDLDMEMLRGVWKCNPPKNIKYFIGATRLRSGEAKILGSWELDSKPFNIDKNFTVPDNWKRKIKWEKKHINRKIFNFGKKINKKLDNTVIPWTFQSPVFYTDKQGYFKFKFQKDKDDIVKVQKPNDQRSYMIAQELKKTTGKGWEQFFLSLIINKYKDKLQPFCQYLRKLGNKNKFFIDLYYHQINLAIEIDEPFHKKQIKKDKERQIKIIKDLGCQVFRIDVSKGEYDKQLENLYKLIDKLIEKFAPNWSFNNFN